MPGVTELPTKVLTIGTSWMVSVNSRWFSKVIQNWLFKKRYIYRYPVGKGAGLESNGHVVEFQYDTARTLLNNLNQTTRLKTILLDKCNSDWLGYVYHVDGEIYGYAFLHVPAERQWWDSLPTEKSEARICSLFVEPEHRGKRVSNYLMAYQRHYCSVNNKKLFAIVESLNHASIKAFERDGAIANDSNYLVKFLGKNIFSITTNPFRIYFVLNK